MVHRQPVYWNNVKSSGRSDFSHPDNDFIRLDENLTHFDDDFLLQLIWRWQQATRHWNRFFKQHVSEHIHETKRHLFLLHRRAVVLDWQDQREPYMQEHAEKSEYTLLNFQHTFSRLYNE